MYSTALLNKVGRRKVNFFSTEIFSPVFLFEAGAIMMFERLKQIQGRMVRQNTRQMLLVPQIKVTSRDCSFLYINDMQGSNSSQNHHRVYIY